MTKIHGIAYIIIGAIVGGYSYYIGAERFKMFLWIGAGLVAFGVIRLLIDSIKKPRKLQNKTPANTPTAQRFCSLCGAGLHDFQNFCHNCGQRIFHKKV